MKKVISFLLALGMVISMIPTNVFAVESTEVSLTGKTISILGDSISTYTGVSNDTSANATIGGSRVYYTAGKLGVYQKDTWWQQTIDQLGLKLLVNNSWSGSQVFGTGADAPPAYIDRCVQLHNTSGETPDMIAVYLGTNDFTASSGKLGTASAIDYAALITDTGDGFTYATPATVSEAYAIMLHKMTQRYPDAEVYCFTLLPRISQTAANVQLAEQFNSSIAQIAGKFGAHVVDLYGKSGIRADSNFKTYMADNNLHPGPAGMDALTGCFTSAILKNSKYFNGIAHNVSYHLSNAIIAEGNAYAAADGKPFSCSVTVPGGYDPSITVTMGGADITSSCVQGKKIVIGSVTGDLSITARAEKPAPKDYCWEYNGSDLSSVGDTNVLNRVAGSINSSGVHSVGQYKLTHTVNLFHDRPWVLEWKSTGEWSGRDGGSGVLLFAEGSASNTSNAAFLYRRPGTDFIGLGYYSGSYKNYGVVLSGKGLDLSEEHIYRVENRIDADGSNMVWLLIDGVDMGPMIQYYEGGTNKNTTSTWVNGKDFRFSYMGTSAHPLGHCTIDYIQVWENGLSHPHIYETTVTNPTCAEQGYTTYTCSCGESYVDDYVDATGNHTYENSTCTICGAIEPETPNDCADGHQFGDWAEHISDVCRKHYVRECLACGEKQRAKDISAQTISFAIPAITANVGDLVNLSLYSVAFDASTVVPAAELTWSGEAVENGCVIPSAAGVYALTASSGANSKTIYLVVKNPEDTEYVLYFDDFNDASLNGYRAIEVPSGTEYYVSDGKLVLDATGNSTNHMRILLPEWIGNFGDYEITTTFSMLSAMADTYWFATMARIQNTDFPYWQAAIRQNATTSNGVEISTRTKASGASSGWTVTHKGAFSEKLSKSKYYQQSFTLSSNKATHAINGSVLLSSDSMTFATGDVGFHLRACKVSVDSVKIVIPADDIAHSYGKWETIREPNCTEKGEQIRSCSNCGVTETGEIDALGHDLTPHAAKMPTCTDPGWMAYETCNRCSHSTFIKEIEPLGHSFARTIHSVAHRGYSVEAPENTLVAYRMAKEKGFTYVECDVAFTADGIPVLLHDNTISRTSDGTGKISELTYAQLLAYDFGSWKDAKYAGTKIPTFEEFISLCAELGLHPYIELKSSGGYTQKSVQTLVNIVEQYGMTANSTWISFESTYLTYVKKASPTARLGYLYSYDASQTAISTAQKLLSGSNEVFLNLKYASITEAGILRAASNGFAVEAWTVNDAQELLQLPGYVSGITSDTLIAEAIVKNETITPPTCTFQGYTTYTCSCGETYVGDYVDATGIHSYENGVCVHCGTWEENTIVITKQPVSDYALIGEKATIFVEADGQGLRYQWYYRDAGDTEFTESTVRKSTYTLTVKATNAARELYCVITDAHGNKVTTKTVKLLLPLAEELKIITQPTPDYARIGEKATISMEVQGVGLSYQWYYRDLPNGSLTKSTITAREYSLTVKASNVNREVYCVITDAHGNTVTTETVNLIVAEPLTITKQPIPSGAILGGTASVSMEVSGHPLKYAWYFKDAGAKNFQKSSITASTYSLTMTEARANREVYCVVTDIFGNKVTSDTVKLPLLVNEELAIIKQPVSDKATPGEEATISVEAKGDALKYTWYFKDADANVFQKSTIQTASYTLKVTDSNARRVLYCVITDAHGNTVTTETVNLIVAEPLTITKQPISSGAILGGTASVSMEVSGYPLKYAWYFRNAGAKSFQKSSITTSTYTLTMTEARANREVYCVVTDIFGNKVTSDTVKLPLLVNEELAIIKQPVNGYAALGNKVTVHVEAKGDALKYQWYFKDSGAKTFQKSTIRESVYTIELTKTRNGREVYCVITDAHGNTVTTKTVKLVGDPTDPNRPVYYTSLNDALKGEAGSNSPEGAVVEVLQENGETIIRLLQDAVLTETLTIANKITLDLNKYTIHSTASPAISVEADRVTIRGGNVSLTASGAGTSNSPSVAVLANSGSVLEMYDVMVTAIDTENGTVVGVMGKENSELKITRSTVIVTAETSLMNVGVHAYGPATLTDCTVIAESNYTGNKAGTAYASHAYGIYAEKDLTLKNCYVWGPHSGVCAKGKTLVDGGTYEGYGHGAFYFAGSNTTAYVYNASVNWAEMREGTYADTIAGTNGAGMYVGGGAKNVSVYMDNCQIYGTLYGIVLRNSGGETNNSIYISNSTFTGCKSYAYRNGHNANNGTLRVYAGVGVNYSAITGKISKFPNYYYETDESYAQNVAG